MFAVITRVLIPGLDIEENKDLLFIGGGSNIVLSCVGIGIRFGQ